MIQAGTYVRITDNSGVIWGQCIKVLNFSSKRIATYGDVVLITVKSVDKKKFAKAKPRVRNRFKYGTLHRALVVRCKTTYRRVTGNHIRFNVNSVVLVNKNSVPISNRIHGPIIKEFCMRWPALGCVTRTLL